MERLQNIHPGEILEKDFMEPLGITAYRLAKDIGVQQTRISQIIRGKRAITPETAMRLALYFGTSPRVWLNLQAAYELEELERSEPQTYRSVEPHVSAAR